MLVYIDSATDSVRKGRWRFAKRERSKFVKVYASLDSGHRVARSPKIRVESREGKNFRDINVEKLDRHRGDPARYGDETREASAKVVSVRSRQTAPFKIGTRGDIVGCDYHTRTFHYFDLDLMLVSFRNNDHELHMWDDLWLKSFYHVILYRINKYCLQFLLYHVH